MEDKFVLSWFKSATFNTSPSNVLLFTSIVDCSVLAIVLRPTYAFVWIVLAYENNPPDELSNCIVTIELNVLKSLFVANNVDRDDICVITFAVVETMLD